jgi:hypothetical protein
MRRRILTFARSPAHGRAGKNIEAVASAVASKVDEDVYSIIHHLLHHLLGASANLQARKR